MHLSELGLAQVTFNLASLELANLKPLVGVRKLLLDGISFDGVKKEGIANAGDTFCRILPILFPNVQKLYLSCEGHLVSKHFCHLARLQLRKPIANALCQLDHLGAGHGRVRFTVSHLGADRVEPMLWLCRQN